MISTALYRFHDGKFAPEERSGILVEARDLPSCCKFLYPCDPRESSRREEEKDRGERERYIYRWRGHEVYVRQKYIREIRRD